MIQADAPHVNLGLTGLE